jgi:serine/threonine-protein kinase
MKPQTEPRDEDGSSRSDADAWGTYFLGPYRVVDEIGVGGMATVELARMDGAGGFQKWVAIKRIHPHLTEDQQFINMFLDEARIAASISHPNVAQVFDLGKDANTYWIAMEYLHGEPLREIMRVNEEQETAIQPEIAARIVADAAEGLHAAHELRGKDGKPLNLVHRDVTPHNLFITYDGVVKVVDFGIAKVTGSLSSTHAGTIKGKIAYMSPEQVRGMQIDRRADVFALGVVLWEMTTGQRLFRVESDLATLSRVEACVVPPPSALDADYPPELEAVVLKALQREPGARYQTAREFSRALQKFLMGSRVFVGPEEVSAYVTGMFVDRVRKREDHLRWAAEVTQTISIRRALTEEESGDLLDLSKLPRDTGESDSVEFDTIREQAAPSARGVPSPIGQRARAGAELEKTAHQRPEGAAQAPQFTPPPRRDPRLSATEAVIISDPAVVVLDEEEEEDEAATLVASSPLAMEALAKGILHGPMGSPLGTPVPNDGVDTRIRVPNAAPAQGVRPPGDPPRPAPPSVTDWVSPRPPGQPTFDIHSSPTAQTMQLRAVRQGASPLVVFAAAVGAGFIAAGLGAIWFVKSRSDAATADSAVPAVTLTQSATPAHPPASTDKTPALPPPTAPAVVDPPPDSATTATKPGEPASASTRKEKPKDDGTDKSMVKVPDLPPDPTEIDEAARPGFLSVQCKPACDRIFAGGRSFSGSVSRTPLPPGSYRIQCIRGDVTKVLTVIIVSDQHSTQGVQME